MSLKQVIVVRQDLRMPKGKLAVQVAHASVEAVLASDRKTIEEWREEGAKKVVLKVKNLDELRKYYLLCKEKGFKTKLIKDAGNTFFKLPTITCFGAGPDNETALDTVVGKLKLV